MINAYLTGLAAMVPSVQLGWGGGTPLGLAVLPVRSELAVNSDDWFDAKQHLAGIKHRYLNNTTRYSVAAALNCLHQGENQAWHGAHEERRGVLLGTAVADYTVRHKVDQIVINGGANALNAVSAPNISANIAATYVAIACRTRAFSTTLTSPFLAGFESLFFAVQALQFQRADAVLSIAAEEALPDAETIPVVPGAVVVNVQKSPGEAKREIAATAWGYQSVDITTPSRNTQHFLDTVAGVLGKGVAESQWVLLHDEAVVSVLTAERWSRWLSQVGFAAENKVEGVFSSPGTVEPMLWAAPWLTLDRPVVLIAIQQCRYLAFFLTNRSH